MNERRHRERKTTHDSFMTLFASTVYAVRDYILKFEIEFIAGEHITQHRHRTPELIWFSRFGCSSNTHTHSHNRAICTWNCCFPIWLIRFDKNTKSTWMWAVSETSFFSDGIEFVCIFLSLYLADNECLSLNICLGLSSLLPPTTSMLV